jgi:two-component system response regulator YesN
MFKLLIADDESLERQAIKLIVSKNCSEITEIEEAANGREAIEKSMSFNPDIILLDIRMPGIDGIEAAGRIKKSRPESRIIFLTAFDYFEYAREAIKIGVENFIVKPAEDEQIIDAIKSITNELIKTKVQQNEQNSYDDKLAKVTIFLESEIVSSLSIGEVNEEQIRELLELMNINSTKGCAAIIRFDGEGLQLEMTMRLYSSKIKDYTEKLGIFCLVNSVKSCLHIVGFSKRDMNLDDINADMKRLYTDLHNEMKNQIKNRIAIGIGNSFSDIKGIFRSFSGARVASAGCEGGSFVKSYEEVRRSTNNIYPIEKEKVLCERIILGDELYALSVYDEIMDWIENSYEALEDVILKAYELIIVINRSIAIDVKDKALEVSLRQLQQIDSRTELRSFIRDSIFRLIEDITYSQSDSGAAIIEKACEYINNNYAQQISLDDLASMVGFSSFYFSKVFKLYKSMNFIDYLTNVRINKGKELLRNPYISVREISELIGYNNADYFTRVFKRSEGITPTDYRNRKKTILV